MSRRRAGALVMLLLAALFLGTCTTQQEPPHALQWGVYVPDEGSVSPTDAVSQVATMAGDEPDYVLRFAAIDEPVPTAALTQVADAGMTPILTLEPWVPAAGVDQPGYALARIAAGDHDQALKRWASELATWGRPVLLRFAHEMNGDWYPWAVGVNGNTAADYVAAWNHVHSVFQAAGAQAVAFVWAPNAPFAGAPNLEDAYPGPDTVDYLGMDGYNWGDGDGHTWQEPQEVFADGLTRLAKLPGGKPIIVTEVASAEGPAAGTDKAAWIRSGIDFISRADRVTGFVWFQANKERDWRFNSSAEAEAAMREALAALPSAQGQS